MKSIIVANWKMNPATFKEAKKLLDGTRKAAEAARNLSVIIAPPSVFLRELRHSYKGKRLAFAAQTAHFEKTGSYTGEISLAQIKDAKVGHVIVGHAERRAMGETNDDVRKKTAAAIEHKLTPIVCVGETTRNAEGEHYTFVRTQLLAALRDVPAAKIAHVLVAYEPVWAIGAPKPMSAREMHEMAIFIRKTAVEMHGQPGMQLRILYGGAIDETNAAQMLRDGDVNGLLVGRASTDAVKFTDLIEAAAEL